jgi:hypothetical protein
MFRTLQGLRSVGRAPKQAAGVAFRHLQFEALEARQVFSAGLAVHAIPEPWPATAAVVAPAAPVIDEDVLELLARSQVEVLAHDHGNR